MNDFFIRIKDGVPDGFPLMGDNFRQAFPHIDVDNLPPEFSKFVLTEAPPVDEWAHHLPYKIMDTTFVKDGDVWTDSWALRELTPAELERESARKKILVDEEIERLKELLAKILDEASEINKPLWQEFIAEFAAFTYDDPFTVKLPRFPRIQNGVRLTNDTAGAAPNVIG